MSKSVLSLSIGGRVYEGWKNISVTLSMENLSGSFDLTMTGADGNPATTIKPNDPCTILINGEIVITGYVDKIAPSFDANNHEIKVSGRDKAGDMIDSSAMDGTGQYKNQSIDQIIKKIAAPYGINVTNNVGSTKMLETFNRDQGATAFETIQKLARKGGFLVVSDGKGGVILTRTGTETVGGSLIEGENILAANCEYDASKMNSEYHVKGQKQGKDTDTVKKIAHNKAVVANEYSNRYRPLLIIDDGQADETSVQDRARWESTIRAARAKQAQITVNGWQSSGGLWGINKLVQVQSNWLGINDMMVISQVNFTLDENGELARITVTPKEAYTPLSGNSISKKTGSSGKAESKQPFHWSGT